MNPWIPWKRQPPSAERDELAQTIWYAAGSGRWEAYGPECIADALLDAGYRKQEPQEAP